LKTNQYRMKTTGRKIKKAMELKSKVEFGN
jgi:hypothetical protein